MATGDGINIAGAYVEVQASHNPADGAMSTGAVVDIATAHASEKNRFLIDFKVVVTAGTPVADGYIAIYKRNSDQPVPTTTYLQTYIGTAILDTQTGNYYLRGAVNDDPLDTFYVMNKSGTQLTYSTQCRMRTYGGEA